tara:strand:+ start:555 stop:707 length:153 start_codon:yes stop_codon:yes gene_type:complete
VYHQGEARAITCEPPKMMKRVPSTHAACCERGRGGCDVRGWFHVMNVVSR